MSRYTCDKEALGAYDVAKVVIETARILFSYPNELIEFVMFL